MTAASPLLDDAAVVARILDHIDHETTDLGDAVWREPVANYLSPERFAAELALLRRRPSFFCPSAALAEPGAYVAREAAGTPLLAVRGDDGAVRVFRNACRHRATQVAAGSGCARAFTCPYHGWTYGLDGSLRHVPHAHGFPGLDRSARGLVPVPCAEANGLVFVAQEAEGSPQTEIASLPPIIPEGFRCIGCEELEVEANWKVFLEGFLEGYHIRSTHPRTFYPIQYDNLNVVESFGPHNRVAFPYQTIEKLRAAPPAQRSAEGRLTYVYHLFPNAIFATFPGRVVAVVLEPLTIGRTRQVSYMLSPSGEELSEGRTRAQKLVDDGAAEDRAVVCSAQRGLASGANEFVEFGLFEGAIGRFHRALHAALAEG
jgi:phenylpropionate dioxygenase-like ring-hydroxylating dioxygenase large terminal subunit